MGSNGISLMNLATKQLEQVLKRMTDNFAAVVNMSELSERLTLELEEQHDKLILLEPVVDLENFRKFLRSPQINDLLIDYLHYSLNISISGIVPKKKILQDDIINYLIGIIEKYFSKLSEGEAIVSIKKYFECLISVCSIKMEDKIYLDIVERKAGKIVGASFLIDILSEKELYNKLTERIEMLMKHDFVPRDTKYEIIKRDYIKSLKQYYQNGFIYLLGEYKFDEFYIPPVLINGRRPPHMYRKRIQKVERSRINRIRERWKHIFNDENIIYVVGGAGYGKSLFLKNIVNNYTKLDLDNSQEYLLIYCDLKTYYSNGNVSKKTMVDFFQESMITVTGIEDISKEFIRYYLDLGRCIILLDALDEVPKDVRNELHKKLMAFFSTCNLNNKVCITSRDRGFIPQQDIEVLEIIPLSDKDIEDYIEKMITLKKFKKEDKATFMEQAQVLIDKEFLNNFLVLSLLVNIYKAEKELPENKIDLYKKCFEYIAKKREEEKSKTGYDWKSIYPLMKDSTFISLSILAAPNNRDIQRTQVEELLLRQYKTKYPDEATAEFAIKEFLEFCSNRTELFVPSSTDDKFKFFHRSFFEYFYSRFIHQQPEIEKMYELMAKFDIDSEVFELTVALVKEDNEEKYQKLIEYMLKKVNEEFSKAEWNCTAFGMLTLAMQVIDDAYYIQKYYEIVISNSRIMSVNKILAMNQRLMCMWIDKGIGGDLDRKKKFLDTFSMPCIQYLLIFLSEVKILKPEKYLINIEHTLANEESDIRFEYDMPIGMRNIPFYLLLYNKYNSLYDLMEGCISKGFNSVDVGSLKKSNLKKGYNNYKKMSQEERKQFLKIFCRMGK